MNMTYAQRLSLLYGIGQAELQATDAPAPSTALEDYEPLAAATYLACSITFKAIRHAGRSPADERNEHFDMLGVYQAYALLIYAYLTLPLAEEGLAPDLVDASVTVARTLFAGLSTEELAEIIESGNSKLRLVGDAEVEHWMDYRQDIDKAAIAFVIAGTDENTPYDQEDLIPLFGQLLSILCEAFET